MSTVVVLISTLLFAPFLVRFLNDQHQKMGREGHSPHGGILVLLGLFIAAAFYSLNSAPFLFIDSKEFLPVIFLVAGFALIGWLVDEYNLRHSAEGKRFDWIIKLTLQAAVSALACWWSGMAFGPSLIIILVSLFMSNAFNMIDGFGMLAAVFLCFVLASWVSTAGTLAVLARSYEVWDFTIDSDFMNSAISALLVFLLWNASPAKISLGAVGKLPLGALLGWSIGQSGSSAMAAEWPNSGLAMLAIVLFCIPLLALALPPVLQALSLRFVEKPLFRFRTPIHFALLDAGWSKARIIMLFVVAQLLCRYLANYVVLLRETSQ